MSSWVLCISKGHESHWSIAVENGFWDLTQFRSIVAGDTVYFWQAGKSFLAMSRATTDASRLAGTEDRPWEDERKYTCRFQFDVVSAAPFAAPRWQQVKALLKTEAGLNTKPKFTDPRQQALLTTYFLPDDWADRPAMETVIASAPSDIIPSSFDHDGRRRAPVERVVREGREKFKSGLLSAYSGACPLTGCSEDKVLEGAHISEYRGPQTNDLRNGLPLRVDVHRLCVTTHSTHPTCPPRRASSAAPASTSPAPTSGAAPTVADQPVSTTGPRWAAASKRRHRRSPEPPTGPIARRSASESGRHRASTASTASCRVVTAAHRLRM